MFRYMSTCRACEAPVAKKAKTCPHCGEKKPGRFQPITGEPDASPLVKVLLCAAILGIIFYFA